MDSKIIREAIKKELKEYRDVIPDAPFGRAKGLQDLPRKSVTGDREALANARAEMAIELIKKNLASMGISVPDVSDQTTIDYYKALKNFPVKFKLDKPVPEVFGMEKVIEGTASVDKRSTSENFVMYLNHKMNGKKSTAQILFDEQSLMQNLRGTDKDLPMLLKGVEYTVKFRNKNIEAGTAVVRLVGSKTTFDLPLNKIKQLYKYTTKEGKTLDVILDNKLTKELPEEKKGSVVVRNIETNKPFGVTNPSRKLSKVKEEGENIHVYKQKGGGWEPIVKMIDSREQTRKLTFIELPESKFGKGLTDDEEDKGEWVRSRGEISNIKTEEGQSWDTRTLETVINRRLNNGSIKVRKSYTKDDTLVLYYDSIRKDLGTDAVLISAPNIVNDFTSGGFVNKKVKVGPKAGGRDSFEKEGEARITMRIVR